jgi:YfiH family protein
VALVQPAWAAIPGLVHGFLPGRVEPEPAVLLPRQVHGTRVLELAPDGERPEADGLVTARSGTCVGVVTADCVPILMVAPKQHVVAAVHAGWRGAAAGIVDAAVARLRTFGVEPDDVEVCLGPAIGSCCYEVGAEVHAAFVGRTGAATEAAWARRNDRWMLDVRAAVRALLARGGVERTTIVGPCTRCSTDYCSYRRDGAGVGRQVSFIGWS